MITIAFDPSIRCTGYAAIQTRGVVARPSLLEIGRIRPDGDDDLTRCVSLRDQVIEVIRRLVVFDEAIGVVETPFAAGRGKPRAVRSAITLPAYGMAVSAVLIGASDARRLTKIARARAGEWCRGLPSPGTDRKKRARVLFAASLYDLEPDAFGAETTAGDVADALLLAHTFTQCTGTLPAFQGESE